MQTKGNSFMTAAADLLINKTSTAAYKRADRADLWTALAISSFAAAAMILAVSVAGSIDPSLYWVLG